MAITRNKEIPNTDTQHVLYLGPPTYNEALGTMTSSNIHKTLSKQHYKSRATLHEIKWNQIINDEVDSN